MLQFLSYAIMIPASIIIVGLWAAFEHSGNTNLGLAKGINVGIYLTVFGYAAIMNTFGTTVSLISLLVRTRPFERAVLT